MPTPIIPSPSQGNTSVYHTRTLLEVKDRRLLLELQLYFTTGEQVCINGDIEGMVGVGTTGGAPPVVVVGDDGENIVGLIFACRLIGVDVTFFYQHRYCLYFLYSLVV